MNYQPVLCPHCGKHMQVIFVLNFFMAHCPNDNHKCWGNENRTTGEKTITGIMEKIRLWNRKSMIVFYPQRNEYEISLYVKDKMNPLAEHKTVTITLDKDEYENRYKNNRVALRKKLELAETFK